MSHRFETTVAIRAYSERPNRDPLGSRPPSSDDEPSDWTLVFDCETTVDAVQQLRFGFFQVRRGDVLDREGIFFDAKALTRVEEALLRGYTRSHELELMTVTEFRTGIFLKYGYVRQGTVVGFNLPFDISRIAVGHGSARREMRGGFSFDLTSKSDDPRVRVKHLSPRAALIDFGIPGEQETPRAWRKRGKRVPAYRGHFVDIKTLAGALLSSRFSLHTLGAYLSTPTQKHETKEHGVITKVYLDYARADVQVTWECFCALRDRYDKHRLTKNPDRMLSEASIGKAYLQRMGINPLLGCDPSFPRERFGEIFCAYYGGRAEVRNRRVVCEVLYCDFKSMYPTVNSLMGLWGFVVGSGMNVADATNETRRLLEDITLEDLRKAGTWTKLCTLVRLDANEDILPARAKYDGETYTIGLNLKTSGPLWYTLADCIVSKLLTGRCPRIDRALTYQPGPIQEGLTSTKILGRGDFAIDPASQDFFTRLVDLRDEAKAQGNPSEKVLKIIANSTSYGIFIEVNRDDAPKAEPLAVFGPNGERLKITTRAVEDPGRYFNPLLGVLITGAARLMLGIAEKKTLDLGLDWAFCDTDSIAIVRPTELSRQEFRKRAQKIIDWFTPLNPYKKRGSILKIENLNYAIGSDKKMEPLYCFAISAKRYALFNLTKGNRPVLRKASAHGLGHLLDPYPESEAPPNSPPPPVPLKEMGVRRWQYDFWYKIIGAALLGHADMVPLDWHPALQRPAAIRYSASSPQLLNWVARWNEGRPYEEQIRPFGFLLSFMPRSGVFAASVATLLDQLGRGRPPTTQTLAPIAPYDSDPARALSKVFDRVTGNPVRPEQLETYTEVLAQYHLSCEDKFANGQFLDRGRTERRHVVATGFAWIGKEANRIGDSGDADPVALPIGVFGAARFLAESGLNAIDRNRKRY